MMAELGFFRDEEGYARVRVAATENHKLLALFFETDLQQDMAVVKELQQRIERVFNNTSESEEFIGNAHLVSLSEDKAVIASQFDPSAEPETLELSTFRKLVARWLEYI
jgi:uncharacterized protein YacL (UPF0231 family)